MYATLSKKAACLRNNRGAIALPRSATTQVRHRPGRRLPSRSYNDRKNAAVKTRFQSRIPNVGLGIGTAANTRCRIGSVADSWGDASGCQLHPGPWKPSSTHMASTGICVAILVVQGVGKDRQADANRLPCLGPPDRRAQAREEKAGLRSSRDENQYGALELGFLPLC